MSEGTFGFSLARYRWILLSDTPKHRQTWSFGFMVWPLDWVCDWIKSGTLGVQKLVAGALAPIVHGRTKESEWLFCLR